MSFDRYFSERARRFSSFYSNEVVARLIGRGALFDRLNFAVEKAVELDARHVLDVGCGSGPLFSPLASRGIRVTGIEPAPDMAVLAEREASAFPGLVDVRRQGWEDLQDENTYDLAVAMGVFDYVGNPVELLRVLGRAADRVVGSFPNEGARTELRRIRYGWHGVDVFGYPRERVSSIAQSAGMEIEQLRPLGRAGAAVLFRRSGGGAAVEDW
jgi:SAM-dependent methyltransferase